MDKTVTDPTMERTTVAPPASRRRGVRLVVALIVWALALPAGVAAGVATDSDPAPAEVDEATATTLGDSGSESNPRAGNLVSDAETTTTSSTPAVEPDLPGVEAAADDGGGGSAGGRSPSPAESAQSAEVPADTPAPEPTTTTVPATTTTTASCERDGQPWDGCPANPDDPSWCTDQGGTVIYEDNGAWRCELSGR